VFGVRFGCSWPMSSAGAAPFPAFFIGDGVTIAEAIAG
jgi:hypothetical protein